MGPHTTDPVFLPESALGRPRFSHKNSPSSSRWYFCLTLSGISLIAAVMKMALSLDSSISPPYLLHLRPAAHSLLRIHRHCRASDSGNYLCYLRLAFYESLVELKVAGEPSGSVLSVFLLGPRSRCRVSAPNPTSQSSWLIIGNCLLCLLTLFL